MTESLLNYTAVNPAVVDAFVRANRVFTRGCEQLTKHYIETARQTFEEGVQAQRRVAGATNFSDLASLQGQVAQDVWQQTWTRSRELADLSTAIARDVMSCFTPPQGEADATIKAQKKAA
jgi:phasin family protein